MRDGYRNLQNRIKKASENGNIIYVKEEPAPKRNRLSTPNHDGTNSSKSRISDLYQIVKNLDKDFEAKASSAVVNDDGTPQKMYHGTKSSEFTVFDSGKSNKKVRLNALGDGFYFTKDRKRAARYGENVMGVYLDIKNPYRVYPRTGGIRVQIAEDFGLDAEKIHRNNIKDILKGKGTNRENPQLKQTYVLLSSFFDNETIKPVQFEIKEYVDKNNRLYLAVALTKIEAGVVGNTIPNKSQVSTNLFPTSDISLADLFSKINQRDKNFLKYVPDEFLNEEQIKAKREALEIERKKYGKDSRQSLKGSEDLTEAEVLLAHRESGNTSLRDIYRLTPTKR